MSQIQGVAFRWKRKDFPALDFPDKQQIGFIAQDLLEVAPQIVSQGNDGTYSVDYGKLTPLLVEAIKEVGQRVETLEKEVDQTKNPGYPK